MGKKVALHNLGCKVNAYEVEAMQQLLEEAGYEIVPFEPGADVYLINTCTVTNIADRKSLETIRREILSRYSRNMSNSTPNRNMCSRSTRQKNMKNWQLIIQQSMYAHISKFRTAVINSVLTVSFLMQEVVSEAVRSRM